MGKEIVIIQNLNVDQITKANFIVLVNSKLKYYFIFMLIVFILNFIWIDPNFDLKNLLPILIVLIVPVFIWMSIKKSVKKMLELKPRFFKNVSYIFNLQSLKIKGENFENIYSWYELVKIKETKDWIFIYTNKYQAILIDKKQQDINLINEIIDLLNTVDIKKDFYNK